MILKYNKIRNFHSHTRPIDLYSSTAMMELWRNNEENINIFDGD